MKRYLFIMAACCLCLGAAPLKSQDSVIRVDHAQLDFRLQKVEGMEAQHTQSIALAKQELEQKFGVLEQRMDNNWMTLLLSLLGLAGGPITAIGLFYFSLKKTRERIEREVQEKVSLELEAKLRKELGEKLEKLVGEKVRTLESAADHAGKGLLVRENKQIMILSPNQQSGEEVKAVLVKVGFKKVDIFEIKEPGKMPSADLYIFDLHRDRPESGWGALEDQHLIDMYNQDKSGAGFLFYTEMKLNLTGIKDKVRHNFANNDNTLPTRVEELLKNHPFNPQ